MAGDQSARSNPTATAGSADSRQGRSEVRAKAPTTVQIHLRLRRSDAELLRMLALERDQTLSSVVRSLLKAHRPGEKSGSPR